jgi:hypothetical protein
MQDERPDLRVVPSEGGHSQHKIESQFAEQAKSLVHQGVIASEVETRKASIAYQRALIARDNFRAKKGEFLSMVGYGLLAGIVLALGFRLLKSLKVS